MSITATQSAAAPAVAAAPQSTAPVAAPAAKKQTVSVAHKALNQLREARGDRFVRERKPTIAVTPISKSAKTPERKAYEYKKQLSAALNGQQASPALRRSPRFAKKPEGFKGNPPAAQTKNAI